MKNVNACICLSALLFVTFSCSKENRGDCKKTDLIMAGTWKWQSTLGGTANIVQETPATTGRNVNLALNSDLRYFIYTNGVLTSEGTYRIVTQNCIHDNTNKQVIDFSSPGDRDMMIEKMTSKQLELSDNTFDGALSSYTKQ